MELLEAQEELRKVNSQLTLFMKKKRALQDFIREENDRVKGIASPRSKAWELQNDINFIELYGRERTAQEIANLMGYSKRQVQRFLEKEKDV